MPRSRTSPHRRQRHPFTASGPDSSCSQMVIMRPRHRGQRIEPSRSSDLLHFPQRVRPHDACIDRAGRTLMNTPNSRSFDECPEPDQARPPSVNVKEPSLRASSKSPIGPLTPLNWSACQNRSCAERVLPTLPSYPKLSFKICSGLREPDLTSGPSLPPSPFTYRVTQPYLEQ